MIMVVIAENVNVKGTNECCVAIFYTKILVFLMQCLYRSFCLDYYS